MTLDDLEVRQITGKRGREYIRANHYTGTCHNGPMCWGLFRQNEDDLLGVAAFATPCSENVRRSVFGGEHKDRVTELHRLFTQDDLPPNTESWFVSRAIDGLLEYKPQYRGLISFADGTEGHVGYIYQALNFHYCGSTARARFYRDQNGNLRHPRQCGVNISRTKAKEMGWTSEMRDAKHRYLLVIGPDRRERKKFERLLQLDTFEYPKHEV